MKIVLNLYRQVSSPFFRFFFFFLIYKFTFQEWQQYASEVGTPNGPTRYVDQSGKSEHLKGFSAFDMERWYIDHMHAWLLQSEK